MNKKILLGSIIAVVILVLVSFTGVVGYQSAKSSTIARASPLFSVRSKRAIDRESKDLTSDYIGKGEEVTIPIPTSDGNMLYNPYEKPVMIFKAAPLRETSAVFFVGVRSIDVK